MQQADVELAELRQRREHLSGDEVKSSRAGLEADDLLEPHHPGRRAIRLSTRAPENGTPSASSSARWRSPRASDPSARTMRCQGTFGSWQSWRTAPAIRGAPGEMSPYERTKPGGTARI